MEADVAVIGAGAAGLAAARMLATRGLCVVVVEARERVGGRVWSCDIDGAAMPVEVGAEFIHGSASRTRALLREARSAPIALTGASWTLSDRSLRRDRDDFGDAAALLARARKLRADATLDAFLSRYERRAALRRGATRARMFAQGFDAVDPAVASARALADEWQSGVDSMSARPLGTYRMLFDHLQHAVRKAGAQIVLGARVTALAWKRRNVRIDASADAQPMRLQARAAIVTVPVGVLRSSSQPGAIAFEPSLPAGKRNALSFLEMGMVARVVLSFATPFWETLKGGELRDAVFFRTSRCDFKAYWTQFPLLGETIVAWAGGPDAHPLLRLNENERVNAALSGLERIFGRRVRRELRTARTHDWSADPFSRGAYSYVRVGGTQARAGLAQPVDATLFFAGEATSLDNDGGTVNGALESGERAAREVLHAMEIET